ncbi:MAG: GNAT family N-acetyltransferase [Thermoanaerobaculia bacterium]|jgi:ribosomal protein S18 acetylase RimI-like enzyme
MADTAPEVRIASAAEMPRLLPALTVLLRDAVDGGASLGFLPPLDVAEAGTYWRGVEAKVRAGGRVLLIARAGTRVVGCVQLVLATRANAHHRAEVQKLCVLTSERGKGIGGALMEVAHAAALARGRTLLTLDTRRGDPAEALYRRLGYTELGVVPAFTRDRNGTFHDTVFFYKHLA